MNLILTDLVTCMLCVNLKMSVHLYQVVKSGKCIRCKNDRCLSDFSTVLKNKESVKDGKYLANVTPDLDITVS